MIENKDISTVDREIVSLRTFNFSRELVFRAWSEADHLSKWWGPKGFTNTFHKFDMKAGGKWSFVMHGPDGTNYKNESTFIEIIKPEKIVFNHDSSPRFQVVATFVELEGKTKVTFRMIFESAKECERVKTYVPAANEENFDRLEKELSNMA